MSTCNRSSSLCSCTACAAAATNGGCEALFASPAINPTPADTRAGLTRGGLCSPPGVLCPDLELLGVNIPLLGVQTPPGILGGRPNGSPSSETATSNGSIDISSSLS